MSDRFAFEDQIMKTWHIIDELKSLHESFGDGEISSDQYQKAIDGLIIQYDVKFNKLFRMFCRKVADKSIT